MVPPQWLSLRRSGNLRECTVVIAVWEDKVASNKAPQKNGNDHKRGARVHPASPDLTVAVKTAED
jgi:hypothetical protein